jgi:hypothetical protein
LNLLHRGFGFAQSSQRTHLVESVFLADLAHGEADVNENPFSLERQVVGQESQVNFATDADNINYGGMRLVGKKLDDLSRDG